MERILVADDDKDILTAIELLLDREPMEALLVGSPAEAVDAVKTNSFAAALLDLNFSLDTTAGQEGIALIDRLKALDETLPIIVMTGWGTVKTHIARGKEKLREHLSAYGPKREAQR